MVFILFFFPFYKACCYAWEARHAAVHGVTKSDTTYGQNNSYAFIFAL